MWNNSRLSVERCLRRSLSKIKEKIDKIEWASLYRAGGRPHAVLVVSGESVNHAETLCCVRWLLNHAAALLYSRPTVIKCVSDLHLKLVRRPFTLNR